MAVENLTDITFDERVLSSKVPFIVDFWAPWCGPCKIISPIVEELSLEYKSKANFGKMNVDENPQKAMKYQVFSIPSLKIFKNGSLVDEIVGSVPKTDIKKALDKYV